MPVDPHVGQGSATASGKMSPANGGSDDAKPRAVIVARSCIQCSLARVMLGGPGFGERALPVSPSLASSAITSP